MKPGLRGAVERSMREVFNNTPKNVTKTGKTGAAKRRMLVAIGLSKARRATSAS